MSEAFPLHRASSKSAARTVEAGSVGPATRPGPALRALGLRGVSGGSVVLAIGLWEFLLGEPGDR